MSKYTGKVCISENCGRVQDTYRYKRGMCAAHYREWLKINGTGIQRKRMQRRPAVIEGDIAKIPLGVDAKNGYAIVDADMAWLADNHQFCLSDNGYAKTDIDGAGVRLHHLIMGKPPKPLVTDHINRDRLDNRKSNLRFVTFRRNIQNAKGQPNRSGFKGVAYVNTTGKWRAYIKPHGKQLNIGTFTTKEEAAKAYDREAKRYWGDYAYLNFPDLL